MFEIKRAGLPALDPIQGAFSPEGELRHCGRAEAATEPPELIALAKRYWTFGRISCWQSEPKEREYAATSAQEHVPARLAAAAIESFQSFPEPPETQAGNEDTVPWAGKATFSSHPNYTANEEQPAVPAMQCGGTYFVAFTTRPGEDGEVKM